MAEMPIAPLAPSTALVVRAGARAPVFGRPRTGAAFLAQLIAERQGLPLQRARRRAGLAEALEAYAVSGARTVRRMPKGYRETITA